MTFPRVRAMILVAVLFVTAGVVVLTAINRDTQTQPKADVCAPGDVRVNLTVPKTDEVSLNLYNGSNQNGLGEQIGGQFQYRGFKVAKIETAAPDQMSQDVAKITYGPAGYSAAWLVNAYFTGDADMVFVRDRQGADVDVVLGDKFQQLATTSDVNQYIAIKGRPAAVDPNTCAA